MLSAGFFCHYYRGIIRLHVLCTNGFIARELSIVIAPGLWSGYGLRFPLEYGQILDPLGVHEDYIDPNGRSEPEDWSVTHHISL